MSNFILITPIVLGLLVMGLLAFAVLALRNRTSDTDVEGLHPQGYWVSIGISIGAGFGIALGSALDNFALGLGMGIAIGAALGSAWEKRNIDKIRPLSVQEKKVRRMGIIFGIFMFLIGAGIFAALLFYRGAWR